MLAVLESTLSLALCLPPLGRCHRALESSRLSMEVLLLALYQHKIIGLFTVLINYHELTNSRLPHNPIWVEGLDPKPNLRPSFDPTLSINKHK
jgi:hypothetical protein